MAYFVFEGVDGVGKTTTIKNVISLLASANIDYVATKEPGGPRSLHQETGIDPRVAGYAGFRDLCVDNPQIPSLVKRALFKADSFYNLVSVIQPALALGKIVLSDRSWVSDLAYGAVLTDCSMEQLYDFNLALTPEVLDMTKVIYLDLPTEVREQRLSGNMTNELDKLGKDIRDSIKAKYIDVMAKYIQADNILVVDTQKSEDEVALRIANFIANS